MSMSYIASILEEQYSCLNNILVALERQSESDRAMREATDKLLLAISKVGQRDE